MNTTQPRGNTTLWIYGGRDQGLELGFECQPLVSRDGEVRGYELLYRGILPASWLEVDTAVLQHLCDNQVDCPPVFVNVANESLMAIPDEMFVQASQTNNVVFELSEAFARAHSVTSVAAKVNRLTARGVEFAIDDFGGGADGLHRLYSLDKVACVKVDGMFLRACHARQDASAVLAYLIAEWKRLGICVVAEWIETKELLAYAHAMGFDLLQGWAVDALHRRMMGDKAATARSEVLPAEVGDAAPAKRVHC